MEREWSCYGGGQFNRGSMTVREVVSLMENGYVMEVASLRGGAWSYYRSGYFNEVGMAMLHKSPV